MRLVILVSNDSRDLQAAANWWVQHYNSLNTNGPILINLMNEWGGHDLSPTDYAAAYNEAIATVRKVYDGDIIIDAPGFGHNTNIAAAAYDLIEDKQLIYSLHIYPRAFNVQENRWLNTADLALLADTGAKCMIGEFGSKGIGGTNWCEIIQYAYEQDWGIFGWAWNGDGTNMNMVAPSWLQQPRAISFSPTVYLDEIITRLNGTPCFTTVFGEAANEPCLGTQIGMACNDNNDYTINDRYNEYCVCIGTFTDALNQANTDASILLFPNPVQQLLNVELVKINSVNTIEIYNHIGQKMTSMTVANQLKTHEIDVSSLPKGTYLVVILLEGKQAIAQKFIKIGN